MKCKQIYNCKCKDHNNISLHTWTKDDNTGKDLYDTISIEQLGKCKSSLIAQIKAEIWNKSYNCNCPVISRSCNAPECGPTICH